MSRVSPTLRCTASTRSGKRCKLSCKEGEYCHVHCNRQTMGMRGPDPVPIRSETLSAPRLSYLEELDHLTPEQAGQACLNEPVNGVQSYLHWGNSPRNLRACARSYNKRILVW